MSRRPALPISLYLSGRPVFVAGDGDGADERTRRLEAAGATVVRIRARDYLPDALVGGFLVVANDEDADFNRRVAADARAAGCLAYAHDQPDVSDLAMPALIRRGPLAIAISTDATAPALSRRLREELQSLLDTAGDALDHLITHMVEKRAALAPGAERAKQLYRIAQRLRIRGSVDIADDPADV